MIHVCFSIQDASGNYSKFLGTTMLSLLENLNTAPKSATINILHDHTLTDNNKSKFCYIADRYNQLVKFYNVAELFAERLEKIKEMFSQVTIDRFNIAMFYRLFIPHLLPAEKKAIYLDADIIVNLDIAELWQTELANYTLGAVLEIDNGIIHSIRCNLCREGFVREENYFNSGVLLMNLEILRTEEEKINAGIKFRAEHPKWHLFDQEVLNYCFETRTLKLPLKFNHMVKDMRKQGNFSVGEEIYHYAGGYFGLYLDINDPFNRLWISYFMKTPWFDFDTMIKIFQGVDELDVARENSIWQIFSDTAGKTRAFIVDEENVDRLEKHFAVRDEEEVFIIDTDREESLTQLIHMMDAAQDNKVFFVGIPNVAAKLKRSGFVKDKNYIDVSNFYSPAWKTGSDSYNLIKAL